MKKTFTTVMPDRIGAFLEANLCVTELGLNITRVSYNKAVDVHMLFIEVEGEEDALVLAEQKLHEKGYLSSDRYQGSVLLLEFHLKDEPGTLRPVLELIRQYELNISFVSSQSDGSGYQALKMGLFVENGREVSDFMHNAALLCPIRVIEYNKRERVLDNTVFYISFAEEIAEKLCLSDEQKQNLIVQSNTIMQMLDERKGSPSKTFEYIGLFADHINKSRKTGYEPRITRHKTELGLEIVNIEPPCGSNTTVMLCGDRLLCTDCGFSMHRDEWRAVLEKEIPGFGRMKKSLLLTHADADHSGCCEDFDTVYASGTCFVNFMRENSGMTALREENPIHAPYIIISKILTGYTPPSTDNFAVIDDVTDKSMDGDAPEESEHLSYSGKLKFPCSIGDLEFEIYEGAGGHVGGETIFVERRHRIVFTGDIFVNIKGFIPQQAEFNRLAPYLMTSVDTDPVLAKAERNEIWKILGSGKWTIFSGHGAAVEMEI